MAKGKRKGISSGGPHKKHGPKRHLFREYKPMVHVIAQSGLLSKYDNYESWVLACQSRGKRNVDRAEFNRFVVLSMEEKKAFFKSLKE